MKITSFLFAYLPLCYYLCSEIGTERACICLPYPHITYRVEELFTKFIEEKGLRKTPERFAILKTAQSLKTHFEIDELHKAVDKDFHVSRATVYNTVELLCECGILRRLLIDTHHALYELALTNHLHLVCMRCGEVREVRDNQTLSRLAEMKVDGFTPSYFSTCVYGICDACREREAADGELSSRKHKAINKTIR